MTVAIMRPMNLENGESFTTSTGAIWQLRNDTNVGTQYRLVQFGGESNSKVIGTPFRFGCKGTHNRLG